MMIVICLVGYLLTVFTVHFPFFIFHFGITRILVNCPAKIYILSCLTVTTCLVVKYV